MSQGPEALGKLSREERALLFERLRKKKEAAAAASAAAMPEVPAPPPAPASTPVTFPGGEGREDLPLSFAQQRVWFFDQLAPGSPAYNIPMNVRLLGDLDVPAFQRACDEIVRRHGSLRTRFETRQGRPVQVIEATGSVPVPILDLSGLSRGAGSWDEAVRIAGEEVHTPFDIRRTPLLRVKLLRLGEREHVALLTMHHIVSDGWSMSIAVGELEALYPAFAAGRRSSLSRPLLPELDVQYADYARAQGERLRGERLAREVEHWRSRLQGAQPLELPTDRPRPPVPSFAGARQALILPPALSAALQALARQERATLFATLLAAFQALLSRHTGATDVVVGTTTANRPEEKLERVIGFFINTLLLRSDLAGDPSFLGLLGQVRRTTLEAFSHQELPFEKLVDELGLPRDPHRAPLLRVVFQLHNTPAAGGIDLPALRLEPFPYVTETSKFDLILNMAEGPEGIQADLRYDTDLFDRPTILRMSAHLVTLLYGIAEDPRRRLSELPLLTPGERHQLAAEWNPGAAVEEGVFCLHERFAMQAVRTPEAVAVSCGDERLTYGELAARSRRLAWRLRSHGVGPETVVGLFMERSVDLLVGVLGVLQAGGAYLPLDPAYPQERLAGIAEDAGAKVVVAQAEVLERLARRKDSKDFKDSKDEKQEEASSGLSSFMSLKSFMSFESLMSLPPVEPPNAAQVQPANLAYVIYTSGSTGRPKGVAVTHANASRLFGATQARFGFGPGETWTLFHSYAFDFSVWEIWGALLCGGRLVVVPYWVSRSPEAFYRLLAEEQVTVLNQTPSAFRQLLWAEEAVRSQDPLPPLALRWVVFGGEALDYPVLAPWFDRHGDREPTLVNMYGITETTVHVTWRRVAGHEAQRVAGSLVGRAIPDLALRVLDRHLRPVPIGVPGEICVGGAGLARGYLGRPGLTAERFVPDPFGELGARLYRSGDLARYRPDGDLEHLGRIDQQVKIRGFRIELGEIEAALAAHPRVWLAAVGLRDGGLAAYVARDPSHLEEDLTLGELREFLGSRLPDYMLPASLVLLDTLPLTPSGKVDRRALADWQGATAQAARSSRGSEPPRTPVELFLAEQVREVLGLAAMPGRHDDFFELGGNSISGAILINRMQEQLGEIVHVVVIFDAPTVADLAAYLVEQHAAAVERLWGSEALSAAAARESGRPERPVEAGDVATMIRLVEEARLGGGSSLTTEPAPLLTSPLSQPPPAQGGGTQNPPVLFVLAPPRSGTTLLRVMLGAHPRLFSPPELELLSFRTLAERRAAFPGRDSFWLEGVTRAVMEARACGAEEAEEIVAEGERRGWTTLRFYRELQGWLDGRLLVDKTPSYTLDLDVLRRAEAGFHDARYLHLLRHPLDMVRSFEDAKLDQIFFRREHGFTRRQLAELIWIVSHQNIRRFLAEVPAARQKTVRFEELVRGPERVLREVCGFLEIDFHPDMADPYRPGVARMADGVHAESRMLGDVKFHAHGGVDTAAADRWRHEPPAVPLGGPGRALAILLGYEVAETPETHAEPAADTLAGDRAPLSFAQERLWFLDRLSPGSSAYNIPGAMRMTGDLDLTALRRCLDEIVRRHAGLRTTFGTNEDGRPEQRIAPPGPQALPIVDLSGLPDPRREPEVRRRVDAEGAQPFDLEAGPLLRVTLLRVSGREHVALFTQHHIVSDGWSMGVFFTEVGQLYTSFAQGWQSPLPELPLQYADYARRQRSETGDKGLERDLAYWRRTLAGVPVLELPADHPRPAVKSSRGAMERHTFPGGGAAAATTLFALGRGERATSYMTLLAAFQALLHRLTGQDDVAAGSIVANRRRSDVERLIGFFVNTLVMRTSFSGDPSFRVLLGRVRQVVLGAFVHQDAPFEKVVEVAQPERSLAYTPLFQAMFTLQNTPPPAAVPLPGLILEPLQIDAVTAKFDLGLAAAEHEGHVSGTLEYDLDLFEPATAARFLRQLGTLIESVAAAPDRRLSELPLLTPAEVEQLVVAPNRTAAPELADGFLHEVLSERAGLAPEAPALEAPGESLTWRELEARANRLARWLLRQGIFREDRVGLCFERSPDLIVAMLAAWKAGAAYVPLDPAYPAGRLAQIVEDSAARLVLTHAALASVLPAEGVRQVAVDAEPARSEIARESPAPPRPRLTRESLAYVLYTSGTTGGPKGVAMTHRGIMNLARSLAAAFGLGPDDRVLQLASPAFDASLGEVAIALWAGATLCLAPRESLLPGAPLAAVLRERGITCALMTPSGLANLGDHTGFDRLVRVSVGGEACPPDLAERWSAGRRFLNVYGPTEVTVGATAWPFTPGHHTLPLGDPLANNRLYVLDRRLQPVPAGVPGEICVAGAGLARGYLNRPDQTAERFVPDPFPELFGAPAGGRLYRTGDQARRLADGRVEFLGRVDRQVKVRGVRVEPGEVEAALAAHPAVREVTVVLRRNPADASDALLVAYFVPQDGTAVSAADLRGSLGGRLPEAYIPSRFVRLSALPMTPNGKLDVRALPDPMEGAEAAGGLSGTGAAPRTPVEEVLAGLWAEVLGLEEVGRDQSFFDLGGHSLSATRLMSRIQSAFGVEVPLRDVFEAPTVSGLAERLSGQLAARLGSPGEGGAGSGPPPLVPVPRSPGDELPLSFGQERLWFLDRLEPGTANFNMRTALRLRGALDVTALGAALAEVVRRHEALRTTFRWDGQRPVQSAAPSLALAMPLIDLSALPEEARDAEVDRRAAVEVSTPFDLLHGPLLRVRLLRLEDRLHVFLLTLHHIVSDGWSMGVFTREVTALYAALSEGRPAPLPPLAVQYPDFSVWQRSWLQGEALERQLGYWRERLGQSPEPLDLPLDRPRPAVQTFRGEGTRLWMDAGLSRSIRILSRRHGASLFMTLLAAFQLLMHRLSGQTDILVGTPIAGRRQFETEALIGFFLNTLVLRTDLSGDPPFHELLARVRETTLGAYAHQDIPFEALLNELQPERDLSRTPFFQVFFNMLNMPLEAVQTSDLAIEPQDVPEAPSKFDLTFYASEIGEHVQIHLLYNADLFDRVRMDGLLAQYRRILEQATERPETALGAFSLLTEEATAVLPDPAAPLGDEWHGAVHELFAARARRHPEREAVTDDEGTWTYGELHRATDRLAARLAAAGVVQGDRVAIYAHRSAPVAWAVLGVLKAGAAFVMLDPAYPAGRLVEMLDLAAPGAWIEIAAAGAPPREVEDRLSALAGAGTLLVRLSLPGGGPVGAEELLAAFPEEAPAVRTGPDDLAYVAFTSGSTGVPKGILGRHGPLSHFLPWQSERFGLGDGDRYSLLSGLAHDPLQRDLFTPLCLGGTVCVPRFEEIATPGRLARWMDRQRVTVAHLTPAMGQILTETGSGGEVTVPSLRRVLLVGDVLTRLDVDRLRRLAPQVTVVNLYGSTETQRAVGYHVVQEEGDREVLPLGRGMKDVQLLVVRRTGKPDVAGMAGVGELGEIWVRSPHLAAGYLGDEELTRDRFRVNPFTGAAGDRVYRTGDLGRYLPEGEAVFAGRADQQVKIRGFRIELGEIEAVLGRLPGVREAVVLARQDGTDSATRKLVAYVVPADSPPPTFAAELRDALRSRLPSYMVPAAFVLLERLPVTPNAKVDRKALARIDPGAEGLDASLESTFVEPEGDLEQEIAAVWREVLGVERVGVQHNFFDLGGHSLLLVRLHARLQEVLKRELSLVDLFNYPSVRALAGHLSRQQAEAQPAVAEVAQDRAQKQIEAARRQKELAKARLGR